MASGVTGAENKARLAASWEVQLDWDLYPKKLSQVGLYIATVTIYIYIYVYSGFSDNIMSKVKYTDVIGFHCNKGI